MSRRTRVCPPGATTALFVEGGDDERMVQALVSPAPIFTLCFDGRTPERIAAIAGAAQNDPGWPGIRSVGVILDAEEDLSESWILCESVFQTLNLASPIGPGLVETTGAHRVGGYLVPDNRARGASETLLLRGAAPAQIACIDAFFACTPNPGTTTAQRDKARAHTLAAATVPGGRPDMLWPKGDGSGSAGYPSYELRDAANTNSVLTEWDNEDNVNGVHR